MLRLQEVISQATANVQRSRRIEYIVGTEQFRELFAIATEEDKDHLAAIIARGSEENLKDWMDRVRRRDYDRMTARELRKLASLRSIQDYNILRKDEIIDELKRQDRLAASAIAAQRNEIPCGELAPSEDSGIRVGCGDEPECSSDGDRLDVPGSNPDSSNGMGGDRQDLQVHQRHT